MRRLIAAIIVGVALWVSATPAWAFTKSGTTYTTTGARQDVVDAHADASMNDTILVPAGTHAWNTPIVITKGISLIGAGSNLTTITTTHVGSSQNWWLIRYEPADYSLNQPFRVSGFTFKLPTTCGGVSINMAYTNLVQQTRIRIDHNVFDLSGGDFQALYIGGYLGVIDHNTFTNTAYPVRLAAGPSDARWWDAWEGVVFGKADNNLWFEDNVGISTDGHAFTDCQYSNRFAFRYNTLTNTSTSTYSLMEQHGNAAGSYSGCFGSEVYGNIFIGTGIFAWRAGRHVTFYNYVTSFSPYIKLREERCDQENPTTNPQPDHVSDTYEWSNFAETATSPKLFHHSIQENSCTNPPYEWEYLLAKNQDFWDYSPTYDGTVPGVGCGTAAQRAAITTCTPGDGFWETTQSCSDLTGLVGASHTANITGTFYKCKAGNVWSSAVADGGFTPLAYPHPLTTTPTAPTGVRIR